MEEFLRVKLNTRDLYNVNVYETVNYMRSNPNIPVNPTWAYAKQIVSNATCSLKEPALKFDRLVPRDKTPVNIEKVVIKTIKLFYVKSDVHIPVTLRMDYIHPMLKPLKEQQEQLAKVMMNGIETGFAQVAPKSEGRVDIYQQNPPPNFLPLHQKFIDAIPLINDHNIKNGIFEISNQECHVLGMDMEPTVYTKLETKVKLKNVQSYFAVPPDHVLAWTLLMTDEQRRKHGVYAEEYYQPPPNGRMDLPDRLLYYFVPDVLFHQLYNGVLNGWCTMVDLVALRDLHMEYYSTKKTYTLTPTSNIVECHLSIIYTAFPSALTQEEINCMACTLPEDFPSFNESIVRKHQEELYKIEQEKIKKTQHTIQTEQK